MPWMVTGHQNVSAKSWEGDFKTLYSIYNIFCLFQKGSKLAYQASAHAHQTHTHTQEDEPRNWEVRKIKGKQLNRLRKMGCVATWPYFIGIIEVFLFSILTLNYTYLIHVNIRGAWAAQSLKCPTPDFGTGHDLRVMTSSSVLGMEST